MSMSYEYKDEIRKMIAYTHMNVDDRKGMRVLGELDEVYQKAEAFDRLYAEFDRGDKDLSKADFDEVYKEDDPLPHLKYLQMNPNNIVEECPHCEGDDFWLEYTKDKLIQSCKECDAPVAFIKPRRTNK